MQAEIVRIGNSKGIRIPASMLKQCGIVKKVKIEVRNNSIILKPIRSPREGWDTALQRMHKQGDDTLLVPDEVDIDLLDEWHED